MVPNPSALLHVQSMRKKYSFIVLMSDFSFEWNGSYDNAALKPKKFFSIKIPI